MSTITMQELELGTAELLPARETLNCVKGHSQSSSTTIVSQTGQGNVIGSGNYDQYGLVNLQVDNNNILSNIGLGDGIVLTPTGPHRCLLCITRGGRAAEGRAARPGGPPACGPRAPDHAPSHT